MTITRGQIVEQKYKNLYEFLCHAFPEKESFIPRPEDLDACDIVLMVTNFFSPYYEKGYMKPIQNACRYKDIDISDEEIEKWYPTIKGHIDDLVIFLRTN